MCNVRSLGENGIHALYVCSMYRYRMQRRISLLSLPGIIKTSCSIYMCFVFKLVVMKEAMNSSFAEQNQKVKAYFSWKPKFRSTFCQICIMRTSILCVIKFFGYFETIFIHVLYLKHIVLSDVPKNTQSWILR